MQARIQSKTAPTTAEKNKSRMTTVACNVYSSSRKGVAVANGNGHAKPREATTVILNQDQLELLNNTAASSTGLVTIPTPSKNEVFECPEESLFYCQCIEGMVLNRYAGAYLGRCCNVEASFLYNAGHHYVPYNCLKARRSMQGCPCKARRSMQGALEMQLTHCCSCHRPDCPPGLVEFGAGDGSPVTSALLKSSKAPAQMPSINAYEIGASAARLATTRAASVGVGDVYRVHNSCFWTGAVKEGEPQDKCLIANPPYIPAPGEYTGTKHHLGCTTARDGPLFAASDSVTGSEAPSSL